MSTFARLCPDSDRESPHNRRPVPELSSNSRCRGLRAGSSSIYPQYRVGRMHKSGILAAALLACLARLLSAQAQVHSQGPAQPDFQLDVPVDEVMLTFHAVDGQGLPIRDLNLDEVTIRDNGL